MRFEISFLGTLLCIVMLTGCGGGSAQTSNGNNNADSDNILQLEDTLQINQSVELILYFPNDQLTNIKWLQTSGSPITLLASTSKVISFTPSNAGNYTFSVSFTKNGTSTETLTKSLIISNNFSPITSRLGHSVITGNKVSFRAHLSEDLNEDIDGKLIQWQQVAGPTVTLTESEIIGQSAIFFDAPHVSKDTYLSFESSISIDETQYKDKVSILIEPANNINSNAYFDTRLAKVFPYNVNSPYKENLVGCVYSNLLTSSCTLSKLPLIAEDVNSSSDTPDVTDIMNRVVVSHQWMGDRFQEFLMNNDPHNDFKKLLRATTAIVISYDIRPSFYWAATGAIYLDAENLWLTSQERDTINEAPDYRADFGNDLQFNMPWRYVKDNDYASESFPRSIRSSREPNDRLYRLSSLLYHELAHANDFLPSTEWYNHASSTRILDAVLSSDFDSDQLSIAYPIQSQTMKDLAQVRFAGISANRIQKTYLPGDIQSFFSSDSASDFYSYSSLREDYAMLFEEFMMQNRFNVYRDMAITNQPIGDDTSSSDYIVTWGQRGRIGDENIKPRVLFSSSRILPEFDSEAALTNITSPIPMRSNENWLENLMLDSSLKSIEKSSKHKNNNETFHLLNFHRYYHKKLPLH